MTRIIRWAVATYCVLGSAVVAHAASKAEINAVWDEVYEAAQMGPTHLELAGQITIDVDKGEAFIPVTAATRLMTLWGNSVDEAFLGLIMPTDEQPWFVTVDYIHSGHISDDDARDWNPDDLMDNLKEGTEASNDYRQEQGVPPIEVVGWVEKPLYMPDSHQLVWSALVRNKGEPASPDDTVNYNTYVLGREGYVAMNLVTGLDSIDRDKSIARHLLEQTRFIEGRQYGDFQPNTDAMAEYGLAALVGGIAAKKLGLLAIIGAFLLKAWKLVLLGFVAVGVGVRKLFGGNKG